MFLKIAFVHLCGKKEDKNEIDRWIDTDHCTFWFNNQKEIKELSAFESIEYSFYKGYIQSLRILSDGTTYISDIDEYAGTKFYSLKLDKPTVDSLSKMTRLLFNLKLDSIFLAPFADHPISFSLIIKSKERTIRTSYNGDQNETEWQSLFKLTDYLRSLCKKEIEHVDSSFVFESKSRLFMPPPPSSNPQ